MFVQQRTQRGINLPLAEEPKDLKRIFCVHKNALGGRFTLDNYKFLIDSARSKARKQKMPRAWAVLINFLPFIDAPLICKQFFERGSDEIMFECVAGGVC
jgi:hypothetical protein